MFAVIIPLSFAGSVTSKKYRIPFFVCLHSVIVTFVITIFFVGINCYEIASLYQ